MLAVSFASDRGCSPFAVCLLEWHKALFERLRTGDLLHRQVTGDGAPHQGRARDETLEANFLGPGSGPGSAPAAGRISSLVQALQRGGGRNQAWTPHFAADRFVFEAAQFSWADVFVLK